MGAWGSNGCGGEIVLHTIDPALRARTTGDALPLVVDLDDCLVRSDLLLEAVFAYLGHNPHGVLPLARETLRGKAAVKAFLAGHVQLNAATLPYDDAVLERIDAARAEGRPVYLASASSMHYVEAVAVHLGVFADHYGSSDTFNLGGSAKAAHLVAEFGAGGFEYIGDSGADLAVWQSALRRTAVAPSASVARRLRRIDADAEIIPATRPGLRIWAKALRIHQYAKNLLVFVPLLAAQHFAAADIGHALAAFIAFSLCASSVYIVNDLIDLAADRRHPRKRLRPFAAGTLPIRQGLVAAPLLLAASITIATLVSPLFLLTLASYFVLTTAYSFWLKRKMVVDVIVLASLYAIRVIGGAAALSVPLSEWLLAFAMFMFTALALIKRYVELSVRMDAALPDATNRDYRVSDMPIVGALAASSGFNAVTVFALYVASQKAEAQYHHAFVLWLVCPVLMYWIARALMLAHRRQMHDDPIVFALRDRTSRIVAAIVLAIMFAAAV